METTGLWEHGKVSRAGSQEVNTPLAQPEVASPLGPLIRLCQAPGAPSSYSCSVKSDTCYRSDEESRPQITKTPFSLKLLSILASVESLV